MASKRKRKTRQEKIILQLKRELARQKPQSGSVSLKNQPRQGSISKSAKPKTELIIDKKKSDNSNLLYDASLIKKDLLKTSLISLGVFTIEIVLYLKLR